MKAIWCNPNKFGLVDVSDSRFVDDSWKWAHFVCLPYDKLIEGLTSVGLTDFFERPPSIKKRLF